MPYVAGFKARGYTQSKRRYPAFIEGLREALFDFVASQDSNVYFNDFVAPWPTAANGLTEQVGVSINGASANVQTGNTEGIDSVRRARGVLSLLTGTATTGRAALRTSSQMTLLGMRHEKFEASVLIASELSTVGEEYTVDIGYSDVLNSGTLAPTNGALFRYNRLVDGDFWTCITSSNGSPTKVVTTVPVVANNGTTTPFRVLGIEAPVGGSEVIFTIDGVQVARITQTIPREAGRHTGFGMRILKSAGNTSRSVFFDWMRVEVGA